MCGRFVLQSSGEELADQFQLVEALELRPRYNIAPTQDVAVIRTRREAGGDGTAAVPASAGQPDPSPTGGDRRQPDRELVLQRWGLIPSWAKDRSVGARMINARGETVAEKPAFRSALRRRRCIVPASGFYEWMGKAGARTPYYFGSVGSPHFGFAGLWEVWRDPDGQSIETCTVITTEANAVVRPVHHRMPVILDPRDYGLWLDSQVDSAEELVPLLVPCPPDRLRAHEVGRGVNDARFDDPACIDAVE